MGDPVGRLVVMDGMFLRVFALRAAIQERHEAKQLSYV